MANIKNGAHLAEWTQRILNEVCIQDGGIEADDHEIWAWLHYLSTEEWADIIAAWSAINDYSPGSFYEADLRVLQQATTAVTKSLATGKSFVGRPHVAKSGNKNIVWQTAMRIRETLNRLDNKNIPNRPPSIYGKPKESAHKIFDKLFE